MAISKALASSTLVIEVEKGEDSKGVMTYRKKNFPGVKGNATADNLYAVAEGICAVIKNPTRDYFLNDSNMLVNDEL